MTTKFYYFESRGIAEPIRMMLSYGGIEFEDIRAPVPFFPPPLPADIKSKCRWGQVPLLEIDGKSLTQSSAIARYVAKRVKLVPEDDFEAALCDEYVDAVKDFITVWYLQVIGEKDEDKKRAQLPETKKVTSERFLSVFESIVKKNDGKHLVSKSLTWADICLTHVLQHIQIIEGVDLTEDFPALKNLVDNVANTPSIKKWLSTRPQTKY